MGKATDSSKKPQRYRAATPRTCRFAWTTLRVAHMPRRFIMLANPSLTKLLTDAIGDGWTRDLEELRALQPMADDPAFRDAWRRVNRLNKETLAAEIERKTGTAPDPAA